MVVKAKVLKLSTAALLLVFAACFLVQVRDQVAKFLEGETTTVIKEEIESDLR